MQRVLILCTGNSCRSQMAEAFWNTLGGGSWQALSAGSKPSGDVHPLAVRVMQELDIDISSHTSKSLDDFRNQVFDVVVTVCNNAHESCPTFPNARETLHWPFHDPAAAAGSEEEKMVVFRRVRDEIQATIQRFLHQSGGEVLA